MINFARIITGAIPVITTLASILLRESDDERKNTISIEEKSPQRQLPQIVPQQPIQSLVPQDINLIVNVNIKLPDFDNKTGDFLTRGMRYYP